MGFGGNKAKKEGRLVLFINIDAKFFNKLLVNWMQRKYEKHYTHLEPKCSDAYPLSQVCKVSSVFENQLLEFITSRDWKREKWRQTFESHLVGITDTHASQKMGKWEIKNNIKTLILDEDFQDSLFFQEKITGTENVYFW